METQFSSSLCDLSRNMGLISQDQLDMIYNHLAIFELLDNEQRSAQIYGDWILANIDICWRGRLIETLFYYLNGKACQRDPDNALKTLRVLYHVTTYCTEIKMQHMSMFSSLLEVLRDILALAEVQDRIVICTLDLLSNFIMCSWMIRDAFETTGLLNALLKKLERPRGAQSWLTAKIVWLLYQFLRHKSRVGPPVSALQNIATTLAALLSVNQDLSILLPLLKITRLVAEHHSANERVMRKTGLLAHTAPLVLSPLYEVKYEAICILANTCQQYGRVRRQHLYRFPPNTLQYIHHLFGYPCMKIRIMALNLLNALIGNRAIDPSLMRSLIPVVIRCASKREHHPEVRLAAGWTMASLAIHLNMKGVSFFMHSGGVHEMCRLLQTVDKLPSRLIKNMFTSFLKIWETYRHLAHTLVDILRECGIMDDLHKFMESRDQDVRTLAKLLGDHKGYDICWVESLAKLDF